MQRGPVTLPLLPILCFGKPFPEFLTGFPYLVVIQFFIFLSTWATPRNAHILSENSRLINPPAQTPCPQTIALRSLCLSGAFPLLSLCVPFAFPVVFLSCSFVCPPLFLCVSLFSLCVSAALRLCFLCVSSAFPLPFLCVAVVFPLFSCAFKHIADGHIAGGN